MRHIDQVQTCSIKVVAPLTMRTGARRNLKENAPLGYHRRFQYSEAFTPAAVTSWRNPIRGVDNFKVDGYLERRPTSAEYLELDSRILGPDLEF